MKKAEWRALIADDEPAARRGVRQLLSAFPEFAVAGECRNGAEVLAALDLSAPYAQLWIGPRSYFLRESLQLLEERMNTDSRR